MRVINCNCGQRIEGADDAALFAIYRAHCDDAHPDLPAEGIDVLLAATARTTAWDGAPRPVGAVEIRALTPDLAGDFLRFFDRDAFMDNPSWSGCYCFFYHHAGDDWDAATPDQNRAAKQALIERGDAQGYLAYADDAPVGWCHAAPRSTLPGLDRIPDFRCDGDPATVGAIVCFNIAAPYRGQGLASKLLDAACVGLRDQAFAIAEAYPALVERSDARDYHGRLQMYLRSGFAVHRESERFAVVRRAL